MYHIVTHHNSISKLYSTCPAYLATLFSDADILHDRKIVASLLIDLLCFINKNRSNVLARLHALGCRHRRRRSPSIYQSTMTPFDNETFYITHTSYPT